jgi:hypothetical protein
MEAIPTLTPMSTPVHEYRQLGNPYIDVRNI